MDEFKKGDRVTLGRINDPYTRLAPGTKGTVALVDSLGTIHVNWDNGSRLGVCPDDGDYVTKDKS